MKKQSDSFWGTVRKHRHFYLFVSPFFILFAIFGVYPLVFSLFLSFVKWDGLTGMTYVGVDNFVTLFADRTFYVSLWNTVVIGILYVPIMFVLAFFFALLLNSRAVPFRGFFRAAVFIPCITPMVVVAIVFGLFYGTESGLFNFIYQTAASLLPWGPVPPIPWLSDSRWVKISIAILLVWRWTGYNMILMLAGLQGIPVEYYEAAKIDGVTRFQEAIHITLPLLRPMLVFCAITSLIGTVYMFDEVFVLTNGGPGTSSMNFGLYLFNKSFVDFRFGHASAAAYIVAVVVFMMTLVILRWRKSEMAIQ
ncbi:sugar ABC transporter permease [Candidatus Sumerlaeota bacterium]|nr:sugar ABC transporter permease [Candidatus Sumerlaeota bacterium]